MEGRPRQIPPQIDNVTDATGINNVLSNKYKQLLNSIPSDLSVISRINEKITEDLRSYNSDDHIITVQEINDARERLKNHKCDGGAGLWSNHVLYSPDVFNVHLSMLTTAMTVHGYNVKIY